MATSASNNGFGNFCEKQNISSQNCNNNFPTSTNGMSNYQNNNVSVSDSNLHIISRLGRVKSLDTCRVCGDGPARMHYGVPTCFGCKGITPKILLFLGFFRRTLKRTKEYTCRYSGNCVVDRFERNSCRYCRFKRCLEVGMDPKAVRPDRDAAGRTHCIRRRQSRNSISSSAANEIVDDDERNSPKTSDDWIRKLPVDMRTLLMQIMNIEVLISNGDTQENPKNIYPLQFGSLKQILADPTLLDGKRTEIRYEPYRQVQPDEIVAIAHRRMIAVIDLVDHLCVMMDLNNIHDKVIIISYFIIFCRCVWSKLRMRH